MPITFSRCVAVAAAVLLCGAQGVTFAGELKFSAVAPTPPDRLPVLRLTAMPPPTDALQRMLAEQAGSAAPRLGPLAESPFFRKNKIAAPATLQGVVEGDHVKAWVDRKTGDAAIYPTLGDLKPLDEQDRSDRTDRARQDFERFRLIGQDDTRYVIGDVQWLNGATLERDASGATRATKPGARYLAYVAAKRFVGDYPVDGPGSRALLVLGPSGRIEGLTRVWKTARTVETVKGTTGSDQLLRSIASQLRPALAYSDIDVNEISLAYYDGNRNFLQPVYRFTARIRHSNGDREARTADDFVIGYVPFAKEYEPLPRLDRRDGPAPGNASPRPGSRAVQSGTGVPNSGMDPIVGRYVVRQDDSGWVNDANAFWNSLASAWSHSLFTNAQYYWAEPRLFTTQKNSFINTVNLALIEVHGDWWLYSTLKNCCDLVNINGDIPSPGYGPSAGGRLADWVIHSCEVVPAPDDTATWPDPWWTIFGGVRNVVGYRTIMYISDGAGGPYGTSLANVAPVVSSWLSDVISLNAYSGKPKADAHGGISRPMGRPSSISTCGHDGDSVFSTSSLGRANCLTVWWFPD